MQINTAKKDNFAFVADLPQLERFLQSADKRRLVLGGDLLVGSMEAMRAPAGLVAQAPRRVDAGFLSPSKSENKFHLLLDKQALELLVQHKTRPLFFADSLLRFGLRIKGSDEYCVLGAVELSSATQVVAMRFRKQMLVGYAEYQIAAPSHNAYEADLHLLMERLAQQVPVANTYWVGPLRPPKTQIYREPSSAPWSLASAQQLTLTGKPSFLRRHGPALALVALTAGGYVGAMSLPLHKYRAAQQAMEEESRTLQGQTAFDSERLSVLRSRQAFFETQTRTQERFNSFVDVLAAFAQEPGLAIRDATLFSAVDATLARRTGKPADFEIVVEVAKKGSLSALDQAKPLLSSLSGSTGGGLRLAAGGDGYKDSQTSKGGERRLYRIQGDFKHAK